MRRGDVVYVDLPPVGTGHVQGGRRPSVFVLSDEASKGNPMAMIVPLTTTLATLRFPLTLQIDPTPTNGLSQPSVALVFQLCAADRTRLARVIGHLEDQYLQQIDGMLRQMLGL